MKLPQLHLRDLFWLVLVAAVGCGWWVRESHHESRFELYGRLRNGQSDEMQTQWTRHLAASTLTNHLRVRDHLSVVNAFVHAVEGEGYEWTLQSGEEFVPLCTTNGDISTLLLSPLSDSVRVTLLKRED